MADFDVGCLHALAQVLNGGFGSGDDVGFVPQDGAVHAHRRLNAFLAVQGESALDNVDDLTVLGMAMGASLINGAVNISLFHNAAGDADNAERIG